MVCWRDVTVPRLITNEHFESQRLPEFNSLLVARLVQMLLDYVDKGQHLCIVYNYQVERCTVPAQE